MAALRIATPAAQARHDHAYREAVLGTQRLPVHRDRQQLRARRSALAAAAASNNPLLKTLVQAVSGQLNPKVDLVDTLNGGEFTVFAPVDDAFAKLPASTIEGLKSDDKTLTPILTYHVVAGQIAPDKVAGEPPPRRHRWRRSPWLRCGR